MFGSREISKLRLSEKAFCGFPVEQLLWKILQNSKRVYAKFLHVHMRIRGYEIIAFRRILRTY